MKDFFLFIMKRVIIFLILMIVGINPYLSLASATQINIYYPNNNTTTDIYYANSDGYNHTVNNSIDESGLSVMIVKNQAITDDIISHPEKIANISYIGLFIMIALFGIIIIGLIKAFRWGL